jgi:hypothetical protein
MASISNSSLSIDLLEVDSEVAPQVSHSTHVLFPPAFGEALLPQNGHGFNSLMLISPLKCASVNWR